MEKANEVLGWHFDTAIMFLKEHKIDFRITSKDEKNYIVTCDFVPERANLTIVNGIIENINYG